MSRTFAGLVFLLFVFGSFGSSRALAQAAQSSPCRPEALLRWDALTQDLFLSFRGKVNPFEDSEIIEVDADEALELAADLQEIRRSLEMLDQPPCFRVPREYTMFERLFDLGTDAIVASAAGRADTAGTLWAEAKTLSEQVDKLIIERRPEEALGFITLPAAGTTVERNVQIRGTFSPGLLGENQLWVFVGHLIAEDEQVGELFYFPQLIFACRDGQRSMEYDPLGRTWYVDGVIGKAADRGPVRLVLVRAEDRAAQLMNERINLWCSDDTPQDPFDGFEGVTYEELVEQMGFVVIESIEITRR